MEARQYRKIIRHIVVTLAFIAVLTMARLLWINIFEANTEYKVQDGVLDLRNWDMKTSNVVTLDGQWEFYPNVLLVTNHKNSAEMPAFINVPGSWNDFIDSKSTGIGYGTYKLTIYVDPDQQSMYGMRIMSIRSSSRVFVNGNYIARSGVPAETSEDYVASNAPYNSFFTNDEQGKIEIVIEVSNYLDTRESGIVRSIKFGSQFAIMHETLLSYSMQNLIAIVFFLHAIYAMILYVTGIRFQNMIWFALFVIGISSLILVASEDKFLHYWLPISYEAGFRIVFVSIAIMSFAMLRFVKQSFRKYGLYAYYLLQSIVGLSFVLALVMPIHFIIESNGHYMNLLTVCIGVTFIVTIMNLWKGNIKINYLILLSFIAVVNHLLWWLIFLKTGKKVVYYPFDLIIAMSFFAFIWSKRYVTSYRETKLLTQKLQKSIAQRDEFLVNTSHELRNPLHSIINLTEVVLDRERDHISDRSTRDLEGILSVGNRMKLLVNELLDVMNLKNGNPKLFYREVTLLPVIEGVVDLLMYMNKANDVQVHVQIDPSLPKIIGDENRIIQIVYNLLHNAFKFTRKGSITIRAEHKDAMVEISVADTGIGMSKATLETIFEPYEQAEEGKAHVEGGLGLGLSISKQLIELHGGKISVSSVLDAGTVFTFTLPVALPESHQIIENEARSASTALGDSEAAESTDHLIERAILEQAERSSKIEEIKKAQQHQMQERQEQEQQEQELSTGQKSATQCNKEHILIVDDDLMNLNVLNSILDDSRYVINQASSAEEALAYVNRKEFDLIICDVMMPGMSGYELTKKVRERYSMTDLPILLLTARGQARDLEYAFECGANDYVQKPVNIRELRSRVNALSSVKKSVRERVKMEAALLQAQIKPHFFFNTLNSLIALSEFDIEQMRKLLHAFSSYLRTKFKFQQPNLTSLNEELELVKTYLYIEKARYGNRLNVIWELDITDGLYVPPLTIQTLVENSIRHGIMEKIKGGTITISVKAEADAYMITIADDGVGIEPDQLEKLLVNGASQTQGLGLLNTNHRLKQHFGSGLTIESEPGIGTVVSFIVPKKS